MVKEKRTFLMEDKDWEELWKRFKEVIGFIYDNKGVIQSLEKQKLSASSEEAKTTLEEQMEEVHELLRNHQEELLEILEKAKKLKPGNESEYQSLERAIQKLNTEALEKEMGKITKK